MNVDVIVGHLNAGGRDVLGLELVDADAGNSLSNGALGFLGHADDQQVAVQASGLDVHQHRQRKQKPARHLSQRLQP